jgi:Zn-dependent protease
MVAICGAIGPLVCPDARSGVRYNLGGVVVELAEIFEPPACALRRRTLLFGGNFPSIAELLTRVIAILIAMDIHEFAHAYVAYRMGDTTARDMGRMTLNPFVNINWLGFAMWVLIGFGILGSAPVSASRMRDRRWGLLAAVAAGPLANLLVAVIAAIPFQLGLRPGFAGQNDLVSGFIPNANSILTAMVVWNVLLFLFNFLPLPPLDGWTVLLKLLPPDLSSQLARYEREATYAFFGLILLSFIGVDILGYIFNPPLNFLLRLLLFRQF